MPTNEISYQELTTFKYALKQGLAAVLKELSATYGYIAIYDNGVVLTDVTTEEKESSNFIVVYAMLSEVTFLSELDFRIADREVVYAAHEEQLKQLALFDEGLVNVEHKGEVEELFNKFINNAVQRNATDIHMSITSDQNAQIFYRIDGEMNLTPISKSRAECKSLIGNCFEWTGSDNAAKKTFNEDDDNDTSLDRIPVRINGLKKEVEIRVHYRSLTSDNKVCTFRICNIGSEIRTLEELGLDSREALVMKSGINMANGLFLISGPTGSGKSTLMASVINEKSKFKVMHTLEDPIETALPDKLTFQGKSSDSPERDIEGFMRTDLDIGVVSEMRTLAQVASGMTLARTGHLVMSTLHANDAISQIERLQNMGISRDVLAEKSLIRILTAQRLVPLLCPECKVKVNSHDLSLWKVTASKDAYDKLKEHQESIFKKREQGCNYCEKTGTKGRKLVFEFVVVDRKGRECIKSGDTIGWVEHLKQNGWKSMADKAWDLILNGEADANVVDGLVPDLLVDESQDYSYEGV